MSAAASVGKLNYASLTMRAAAEAVLEEGCGAELSKTRGGDTASGGSGVSPPLQLSHHFCFVLLKLLDSTYLGELIMTDPRRRPLVLKLGRTVTVVFVT